MFTAAGYTVLRTAMTSEGEGFGMLGYFFPLSFVLTSLSLILYQQKKAGVVALLISLTTGILYAFLSTGRTFILLLFCLSIFPLIVTRTIRAKSFLLYLPILFLAFVLVALMTGKGVSAGAGIAENASSFANNLRSYTIAPFIALSEIINQGLVSDLGANSFRFFISLLNALGLTDTSPISLVRDYVYTPDLTNVYTVYEVYVRDFLLAGLFIPPTFLLTHQFLYRKASKAGGVWIFFYSSSTYPLLMQFFQDQYFSLMSQWVQITLWYFVFIARRRG